METKKDSLSHAIIEHETLGQQQDAITPVTPQADREAQMEAFAQRLNPEHPETIVKKLPKEELDASMQTTLKRITQTLEVLIKNINARREQVMQQHEHINAVLEQLTTANIIRLNEESQNRTNASVEHYVGLLDKIIQDVTGEYNNISDLLDTAKPHVIVSKESQHTFASYVAARLDYLKHYTKRIEKDIAVSFSRYAYGLAQQQQQLEHLKTVALNQIASQNTSSSSKE